MYCTCAVLRAMRRWTFTHSCGPNLFYCTASSDHRSSTPPRRVRFAPSPTGPLHAGGLRTALVNYLFARGSTEGVFILRIEDTDLERTVPGAAQQIEEDLQWMGLIADESPSRGGPCGPYVQSQRHQLTDPYRAACHTLLENGAAYRCFCSANRLELLRRDLSRRGLSVRYDARCRPRNPLDRAEAEERAHRGEAHVIRLNLSQLPPHASKLMQVNDLILGHLDLTEQIKNEADPILLKADGWPVYHLASVVDDHAMHITHVIRGSEWLPSLAKHLALYHSLGWSTPTFAHLPLLLADSGAKLSKRSPESRELLLSSLRQSGHPPEAVRNWLFSCGGGGFDDQTHITRVFTLHDLAAWFHLPHMSKHPSRLDMASLKRCTGQFLRHWLREDASIEEENRVLQLALRLWNCAPDALSSTHQRSRILNALRFLADRLGGEDSLAEVCALKFVVEAPMMPSEEAALRTIVTSANVTPRIAFNFLERTLAELETSNTVQVNKRLYEGLCSRPSALQLIRLGLIGAVEGPKVSEIVATLGLDETRMRLQCFRDLLAFAQHDEEAEYCHFIVPKT